MITKGLMSSARGDWRTPAALYAALDKEFGFTFDPCPIVGDTFEMREDGLTTAWAPRTVFCNPPYGREIGRWVHKAWDEAQKGATVVLLIPARTDTAWWHDYVLRADEIRLIRGRLKFEIPGKPLNPAPFPSAIVVFRRNQETT